jgi:putative ABC transport system permease protein
MRRAIIGRMDFKFALRSLRKTPGFTLLAIAVMALGIGANTAVFSVVNTVLLKPLAYSDPDRIVTIRNFWKKAAQASANVSAPDFHDWHDQSSVFENMAYHFGYQTGVQVGSVTDYAQVAGVTPEFFAVFGADPLVGRGFNAEEQKPKGSGAAIVSASYWQRHFGGNANVIGKTLRVDDKTLTIVGTMPAGFDFPQKTEIWFPANTIFPENDHRSSHNYRVVGRLKPGVTLEQAQAQMNGIAARLEQLYPNSNQNKGVTVDRMRDTLVGNVQTTLYVLLAAVGVVLLIACANMANLLLAKASARTREMAIRSAVGASRGRIVRQLIVESLVLALISGIAGLLIAVWGAEALVALAPSNVPRLAETRTDGWVLVFTLGVSIASSLLFGLAPALHSSKVDLNDALKQGGARTVAGGGGTRIRNSLVVVEIALSVMLLAGAGLLIRSFQALMNVDNGFRPEKLLVAQMSFPSSTPESRERAVRFDDGLLEDLRHVPGATSVGGAAAPPGTVASNGSYWIDRLPPPSQISVFAPQAVFSVIAPGTFETLGIAVKSGRDFNSADQSSAPFAAMINEALAKKSFPGEDPIGRMIFCGLDSPNPMKIVGVVGDVRQFGPATAPWPEIFMPYPQHPGWATGLNVIVRTQADPLALSETLRRKIREHSPDVPVKFTTVEATLAENVATPRFRTLLLGIFAAVALCLAMAGVYGVMAYVVTQRANEIGLRMALGASSADVLGLMLRQGMTLAAIGLGIGLAGAAATNRLLTSMLFDVKATDPLTYIGVVLLLGIIALAASYIPARRAAQVDPLVALRQE